MRCVVVLFTRDLRVHDHPALAAAAREAEGVVPLFVLDDGILDTDFARPNRLAFLREALVDLDRSLRARGSFLTLRRGDVVQEAVAAACAVGAEAIFSTADVSAYAQRREHRLARAADEARVGLRLLPGVTIVPPDALSTTEGRHFSVFTPYHRRWREAPRRAVERAPARLTTPCRPDGLRALDGLSRGVQSPELPPGGETAARTRLTSWRRSGLGRYGELHDDLAADGTSRLSPYLHFGCLSPLEVLDRVSRPARCGAVRPPAVLARLLPPGARRPPRDVTARTYRGRGDRWRHDDEALEAWKEGRTGYPIVDAGMRQLLREGWMHNRARLITGSFLAQDLYLDWRLGARHFFDLLVDGDVASNSGTGSGSPAPAPTRGPNRVFNPIRQARRFDPDGAYVRRYVPELAEVDGPAVHRAVEARRTAPGRIPGADCRPRGRDGAVPRRPARSSLGRPRWQWDEGTRLALVAAVVLAPALQRLLLGRRDAGHEDDEEEHRRRRGEAEPAVGGRERDERVGDPRQPLEEVVRVARVAPEAPRASSSPRCSGSVA